MRAIPLRSSLLLQAILFGIAGFLVAGLSSMAILAIWGPVEWSLSSFLWFKAVWAAVYSAFVTPLIAWTAIASYSMRKTAS